MEKEIFQNIWQKIRKIENEKNPLNMQMPIGGILKSENIK